MANHGGDQLRLGNGTKDDDLTTPRSPRSRMIICYDIPDDKRRTKVMKTLAGYGYRVQYSVFECALRPADLTELRARLTKLVEPTADDVRFYPLCERCLRSTIMLGKATEPPRKPFQVV